MSHQGAQSNEAGVWIPHKDEILVRCIANRLATTVITSRYLRDFSGSECLSRLDELTDTFILGFRQNLITREESIYHMWF